jgi:hypothetical protein
MLRPVLPLNLIPRDVENVAAGVAGLLAFALVLMLPCSLLDRQLLDLPKRALGEMLIDAGPERVRDCYTPNSGANAAEATWEAAGHGRAPARSEGDSGDERLPSSPKFLPNSWLRCCSSVHSLLPSACLRDEAVVRRAEAATDVTCGVADAADGESETDATGCEVNFALKPSPTCALLSSPVSHWRTSSHNTKPLPASD